MKVKYLIAIITISSIVFYSCTCKENFKYEVKKAKDSNGYEYEYVTNDPINARIYTLKNGLKVFLTINKDEPRLAFFIGVKAGSTYDPPDNTGLAHYLEHMMFKGTSKIGTLNWQEESKLIEKISELYEKHKQTQNVDEKKKIYAEIDKLSNEAAKYAIPNEYDKISSLIGAKNTNAYTSEERTVYMTDIPKNELERLLIIERERFTDIQLRLFHTELETVYEEFNMYQDSDADRQSKKLLSSLFKKHPYGTQTVIGKAEHLKNPSMKEIKKYYSKYYVPNNMAIAISGDIEFEETIKLIDKYFGDLKKSDIEEKIMPKEEPITKHEEYSIYGPESENVMFAFRLNGRKSQDYKYIILLDNILSNSKAGLIDLNLVQKQKVLDAYCFPETYRDYTVHVFYGKPKEGQTLEDVKNLLLQQIELVKEGKFDDWLIEAVANDYRLKRIYQQEKNWRAHDYIVNFSHDIEWIDFIKFPDELEKVTKQELVNFVKENYKENYVVVYKRLGRDTGIVKVEKPNITPLTLNRDTMSEFYNKISNLTPKNDIEPQFVDFSTVIKRDELSKGINYYYLENKNNELFNVSYIVDIGYEHNIRLPIAIEYLQYVGTKKYSPEEFQKELYKNGLNLSVYAGNERCYISISGLNKSFEKGLELLEDLINNAKGDNESYNEYVNKIIKQRENNKQDKDEILWGALMNYGMYGKFSPYTNIVLEDELRKINHFELTQMIKDIMTYNHYVFYYGNLPFEKSKSIVTNYHKNYQNLKNLPKKINYIEQNVSSPIVYFVNYDMVQTNIIMLAKDEKFNKLLYPMIELFNEYFGNGLASVVFQEIRESKGLAYSAFANYTIPFNPEKSHYVYSFIGTQPDKLREAMQAMINLFNNMPRIQNQFEAAKDAIIKRIRSSRITRTSIFWTFLNYSKLGINYDYRKDVYEKLPTITIEQLADFVNKHVKNKNFVYLVVGNKESMPIKDLQQLGKVEELTLRDIFNY